MPEPAEPSRFLLMEFDGGDLIFARATRQFDGATVDLLSEPQEDADGLLYSAVFLVRGLPESAMERVERDLTKRYEKPKTLRRDVIQSTWMGRIRMRASAMTAGGAKVYESLHRHWGLPWIHIEGGQVMVRARVVDAGAADSLARRVGEAMAAVGVASQVEVQEVVPKDFGVWKELVEASLGLSA
jgi:hypothetical protein